MSSLKFTVEGIGHFKEKIEFEYQQPNKDYITVAIYALNGSGKTTISRCFSELARLLYNKESPAIIPAENLVNNSTGSGKFYCKIVLEKDNLNKNNNENYKILESTLDITKNGYQLSNHSCNIILHVFNSDYVKKQFKENFTPEDTSSYGNGSIIVGEANIEINDLEKKIEEIKQKNKEIQTLIENEIREILNTLKSDDYRTTHYRYNVLPYLEKFKDFRKKISEINNNYKEEELKELKDLEKLKNAKKALKEFEKFQEENNTDIDKISLIDLKDINFEDINKELQYKYNKADVQSKFLEKIKNNQDFIKKGKEILANKQDNLCPYCEQSLDNAQEIIKAYDDFFDTTQQEATIKLDSYIKKFKNIVQNTEETIENYRDSEKQFNKIKEFFHDFKNVSLPSFYDDDSLSILNSNIEECIKSLEEKKKDITKTDFPLLNNTNNTNNITNIIDKFNKNIQDINEQINNFNKHTNDTKNVSKSLTPKLIDSFLLDLDERKKEKLQEYDTNKNDCEKYQTSLNEKQKGEEKKTKIQKTYADLIKRYFGYKYTVVENSFTLKTKETDIKNPNYFLSDGEKSIIAFCYFLANSWANFKNHEDYQKLFFIIDDPISSMDFNFVFKTTNILDSFGTDLKYKNFKEDNNTKEGNDFKENKKNNTNYKINYIIFTHNSEFINIIKEQPKTTKLYLLTKKKFKHLKGTPAVYHSHLQDIINAKENREVSHTTYNSIRHILETLYKFFCLDFNNDKLQDFTTNIKLNGEYLFPNEANIVKILHHYSHGRFPTDNQPVIDEDEVIQICEKLIAFIEGYLPGQLTAIEDINQDKHKNKD